MVTQWIDTLKFINIPSNIQIPRDILCIDLKARKYTTIPIIYCD